MLALVEGRGVAGTAQRAFENEGWVDERNILCLFGTNAMGGNWKVPLLVLSAVAGICCSLFFQNNMRVRVNNIEFI